MILLCRTISVKWELVSGHSPSRSFAIVSPRRRGAARGMRFDTTLEAELSPPARGIQDPGEASYICHRAIPAQPGVSKERLFESTFVIPTLKRTKSSKKSASAKQNLKRPTEQKVTEGKPTTGRPEKPLRPLGAKSPDSLGSTAPKPANKETSKQDRR